VSNPAIVHRPSTLRAELGRAAIALGVVGTVVACAPDAPRHTVIPVPASVEFQSADTLPVSADMRIAFDPGDAEGERIGRVLAALIGNSLETTPPVVAASGDSPHPSIHLTRRDAAAALGEEGYELTITSEGATLRAAEPAGLFYGVQTVRQLLSPVVEYSAAYGRPLSLPAVRIADSPRFGWRGAMLDVARHFLTVREVKRFIDSMALYKLNYLHLHLSDDQGWRIEIPGWPNLAAYGGSTEVGGGPGGYYTVAEYSDIVRYAEERFVVVVPEIDVPGHTNAALASYPDLNCDGIAPDLYTGTSVGFSSLCPHKDVTYFFLNDVVREISRLTPGPFFHVGGDEVERLSNDEYVDFIGRVQGIVRAHGKRMVGWDEIASADLAPESVVQLWRPLWPGPGSVEQDSAAAAHATALQDGVARAVAAGATFILSPADRFYLDMKYDRETVLGLSWAGLSTTRTSYDWEVADLFGAIPEASIAGVEATLWSETLGTLEDFEYMAFPRLAGVAEFGWSPASVRNWEEYRMRLAAHAARWTALGVNFRRSPQVPWVDEPNE